LSPEIVRLHWIGFWPFGVGIGAYYQKLSWIYACKAGKQKLDQGEGNKNEVTEML